MLERLRYVLVSDVELGPVTALGAAGHGVRVTGKVGTTAVRLEVLLTRVSGGSWYLEQSRSVWLGRLFAAQA